MTSTVYRPNRISASSIIELADYNNYYITTKLALNDVTNKQHAANVRICRKVSIVAYLL